MSATRRKPVVLEPNIRRIWLASGKEKVIVQFGTRQHRMSRLCDTYEEAKAQKKEWTERGLPPKGAAPLSPNHQAVATLDDGLSHRVKDLELRGKDSAVPERIMGFLSRAWPAGAAIPLHEITLDHLREYRQRREQAGSMPNTIVRELREFRAMLKKAVPELKVTADIFPTENLVRVRTLAPATYTKVFACLREQSGEMLGDMADLAMLGVMRLSDVRLLQRKHVNLGVGVLELPSTKSGPRAVRLCKEAVAIVKRALARHRESPYVFPNPQGKPYSRVHISRCWRKAARTCGLANFSFHDLRKVLPTRALNRGASTAVVQMMGGWASARMVERYASVLNPTLDQYLRPPR